MKTKVVWFIAAFVIAPLLPLCYGQANQIDNRLGYNPGNTQTYTYSVTNSGQPQYNGTVQYGGSGAYTAGPAPARQPVVAQQPVQPRVAYQQTIPQTQGNQQVRPLSKAASKKKPVRSARAANTSRLITAQPAKSETASACSEAIPAELSCSDASRCPTGVSSAAANRLLLEPVSDTVLGKSKLLPGLLQQLGLVRTGLPPWQGLRLLTEPRAGHSKPSY